MSETNVIVEGRSLSKEFNGNVVLRDVSIRCEAGKAIALVGENGAGKSTLMNILTGSLTPTSGTVLVDGKEVHFTSPHQSKAMGLAFVHQELSLMEEMTVGENIMLGREPRHFGLIDSKTLHRQAEEILRDIGYEIDVHAIVSDIAPSDKQITEIAKAWAGKPRMMIFDEPTSSLNQAESVKLFRFIDRIKKNGVAVIMISHRMDDIFETCDYITVHVPQTPDTKNMINKDSIAKMKDGVRILNFARGGLVNSADVVAAIEAGKVAAYVTDFPSDDLLGVDGVIAIPHLGASTPESEDNCARMAADELMAYLSDGNIINSVNFPALSSPRAAGCSRVCVFHKNIPSMLSQVTKLLSDKGVNIENMQSKSRKDVAYTVLDCAGQVGQDALESLVDSEGIIRIRVISA